MANILLTCMTLLVSTTTFALNRKIKDERQQPNIKVKMVTELNVAKLDILKVRLEWDDRERVNL